jgi:hypothetical protein
MKCSCVVGLALLLFSSISSRGQMAGDYQYIGYEAGFYGDADLGFGNAKIILADQGVIMITSSNTFSGEISGQELTREIVNVVQNDGGEKRYFSGFSFTNAAVSEPVSGTVSLDAGLVLQISAGEGSFPFYFNTTTNVALSFSGVENEEGSSELGVGLLLRKGSGLNNASAQGTYAGIVFGHRFDSEGINGVGNIERSRLELLELVFDGTNAFAGTSAEWVGSRLLYDQEIQLVGDRYVDIVASYGVDEQTNTLSGTYALQSNGEMSIHLDGETLPMHLSADGNLTAALMGGEADSSLLLMLKQPTHMASAVSAVFFLAELEERFDNWGPAEYLNAMELGRTYLFLNPDNSFSMRSDYWESENLLSNLREMIEAPSLQISRNLFTTEVADKLVEFSHGTYSIAPDGAATLYFSDGEMGLAQVSENGEYLVAGFYEGEGAGHVGRGLVFGIRRQAPATSSEPIVFTGLTAGASGAVVHATAATPGTVVEGLYTDDLNEGEWYSAGVFSEVDGLVTVIDSSATNATTRFYYSTFQPW